MRVSVGLTLPRDSRFFNYAGACKGPGLALRLGTATAGLRVSWFGQPRILGFIAATVSLYLPHGPTLSVFRQRVPLFLRVSKHVSYLSPLPGWDFSGLSGALNLLFLSFQPIGQCFP